MTTTKNAPSEVAASSGAEIKKDTLVRDTTKSEQVPEEILKGVGIDRIRIVPSSVR
jgi:hypothetical protein